MRRAKKALLPLLIGVGRSGTGVPPAGAGIRLALHGGFCQNPGMRPLLPLLTLLALCGVGFAATAPIRVLVWDERQPEQKKAYDGGFLGDAIAKHLAGLPGLAVKSVSLDSPEQALGEATLAETMPFGALWISSLPYAPE